MCSERGSHAPAESRSASHSCGSRGAERLYLRETGADRTTRILRHAEQASVRVTMSLGAPRQWTQSHRTAVTRSVLKLNRGVMDMKLVR